jgi:flagellar export protein FliJ
MSRFEFRLQIPLRMARAGRVSLRRDLAHALRELLDAQQATEQLQIAIRGEQEALRAQAATGIGGAELQHRTNLLESLGRALPALESRISRAREEENRVRQALAEASRQVETLERMRREAYDAWRRDQARQELAALDDTTMMRRGQLPAGPERS